MAKLSTFSRDPDAMRNGAWMNPGVEYGFEIKTKAMGSAFADNKAARMKRAARLAGGEDKIGQEVENQINVQALVDECLLDVRGLENDDGSNVTIDEFKALILLPENSELAVICFRVAGAVGLKTAAQLEAATGN